MIRHVCVCVCVYVQDTGSLDMLSQLMERSLGETTLTAHSKDRTTTYR